MTPFKTSASKSYKRDSCNASAVSLSSQVSLSSKSSRSSRSSRSSIASSLAQAKQATTAAWATLKRSTSSAVKNCKTKTKAKAKAPLSPRPCSPLDNPFNDYTYLVDAPDKDASRVSRLMLRLGRRTRYSAITDSEDEHEDSDRDCDISSVQPFLAGREQPSTCWQDEKMTVVVLTAAHGSRYATTTPFTRDDDDEWYC